MHQVIGLLLILLMLYTRPIAHISVAWLGLRSTVGGVKDILFSLLCNTKGPTERSNA